MSLKPTKYSFTLLVNEEPVSYFSLTKETDGENITNFSISIETDIIRENDWDTFQEVVVGLHDSISTSNEFDSCNNITYTVAKRVI